MLYMGFNEEEVLKVIEEEVSKAKNKCQGELKDDKRGIRKIRSGYIF